MPGPTGPTFDAGSICFVVDWAGVERPVSIEGTFNEASFDGGPTATLLFVTDVCSCGFASGSATCSVNPGLERWDGTCTNCSVSSDWCRRGATGLPTEGGEPCRCGTTTGVGYCDPFSGTQSEQCACPEQCVGPQAISCDTLPCGDAGVAVVVCQPDGGTLKVATPCLCVSALDGGR